MKKIAVAVAVAVAGLLAPDAWGDDVAYSAASYSREGLVAQWDGIENAGLGKPHDPLATVWKDLAGERDLPLVSGAANFSARALVCVERANGFSAGPAMACTDYKTIEICLDQTSKNSLEASVAFYGGALSRMFYFHHGTGIAAAQRPTVYYHGQRTATQAVTYGDKVVHYENGVLLENVKGSDTWSTQRGAELTVGGSDLSNCGFPYCGGIYAIRLYDRVLSPEEIAAHAAIDAERFFGGETDEENTRVVDDVAYYRVVVRTDEPKAKVALEDGDFSKGVDGWYTAGESGTVSAKGGKRLFQCWTFNGVTMSHAAQMSPVASFTVERAASIEPCYFPGDAADLRNVTAASYSREGLVAQWDGIENAGLGLPHDDAASVWKDLVGDNDLTLDANRGSFDADGLVCAGGGYAAVGDGAITDYACVEVVFSQASDNPGDQGEMVVFYGGSKDAMVVLNAKKHYFQSNGTTYAMGLDEGTVSLGPKGSAQNEYDGRAAASVGSDNWGGSRGTTLAVGGGSNGVAQYSYKGKILAVRVYSETPSSEARLRNLAIDRLRFFGAELPKDGGLAVFMQ